MKSIQRQNRHPGLPLFLSFALPFLIAFISYAILGIYPFGDGQLLAHDQWHQYYPFFVSFREKLLNGGSLQYTWDTGMGTSYAALYAYYLGSPLYLLSVFVPSQWLREFFALATVLKFSFAGLFFALFLRTAFRRNDLSIPFFSLMYALCAWAGGYAWNIMWLDVFALLPLLIAGTVSLLREGRYRMYVISLALSLWANYYIAFFSCIFVLLSFFGYSIIRWAGFRNLLIRFLRIGLCTLLAVGLTAVLMLPTLLAMKTTDAAAGSDYQFLGFNIIEEATGKIDEAGSIWTLLKTETLPAFLAGSREIANNLLAGRTVTSFDQDLPNLFCSFTAVMLMIYGFFTTEISLREKLWNLFLILFFLLSFLLRGLDYLWHGMHFPNMLPFRFSFLFSFVLITSAYRSFTLLDKIKKWYLIPLLLLSAAFIVNYYLTSDPLSMKVLVSSVAVIGGVLTVLLLYHRNAPRKQVACWGLFLIICSEMVLSFGLSVAQIGCSDRPSYPANSSNVQALLDHAEELEAADGNLFWRTEATNTQTLNDGALNGFYGVSTFSSSANVNFNRFSRCYGLSAWPGSNRYCYYEAPPFSNTLLGIKYLLARDNCNLNPEYNLCVASSGDTMLLENKAYISAGFMTDMAFADYVAAYDVANFITPVTAQENTFRSSTGITDPLYEEIYAVDYYTSEEASIREQSSRKFTFSTKETEEKTKFNIVYTAQESGLYCATSNYPSGLSKFYVYVNNEFVRSYELKARSLFVIGELKAGDEIRLEYRVKPDKSGTIWPTVVRMDDEVFQAGFDTLKDEPLIITEFSDTHIRGSIDVLADGFLYTSFPYAPGWRAWVDGEEVILAETYDPGSEYVKITDAVISFPLEAGHHEIELRYETPGLRLGAVISCASLLIFLLLLFLLRKKPYFLPDEDSRRELAYVPPVEEEEDSEPGEEDVPTEYTLEEILLEHAAMEALEPNFEPTETADEAPLFDPESELQEDIPTETEE